MSCGLAYRPCFLRGPEGIIIGLAAQLGRRLLRPWPLFLQALTRHIPKRLTEKSHWSVKRLTRTATNPARFAAAPDVMLKLPALKASDAVGPTWISVLTAPTPKST